VSDPRGKPRTGRALRLTLACLVLVSSAAAQRRNDPANCEWCLNDPALLEAAEIVSHGPFAFGNGDTSSCDQLLATSDIRWIESKHFRIGFALGQHKVRQEEKKKIRAELGKLALALPEVNSKTKILDPWLRAHLYAQRCEEVWTRFLELMQVSETDFPATPGNWTRQGKYWGEGPYVGQREKFEMLILPSEASHVMFLKNQFGLLIRETQRWNMIDRDALTVIMHTGAGGLRDDGALHGHVAFNLTINLLDGYQHYSYETPIWIREGLAHYVEREISPEFNTFDSSEGAVADKTSKSKWEPEVKKLLATGKAPRMAELINLKGYAELELPHHFATWGIIDYLVRSNPAGFACLNDELHGRMNSEGFADGSNLEDVHREAFKTCLGMNYAQFDKAWAEWVSANY
jgi:hypothetical protein